MESQPGKQMSQSFRLCLVTRWKYQTSNCPKLGHNCSSPPRDSALIIYPVIKIFPSYVLSLDLHLPTRYRCWGYCYTCSHSVTHTHTHTHTRYDSPGRGIVPSQRSLPVNTQHIRDGHPYPRRNFNRQSQQQAVTDPRLRLYNHWDRIERLLICYCQRR
jgi:hypothetical protein